MCDAMVAMSDVTQNGNVLFAKNSDRPAGECQVIHYSPGGTKDQGSDIQCSYVRLPGKKSALATLGCRPYWCWGYETGMNEAGVVGGNTAIFTRSFYQPESRGSLGLTGMDLLRLGLERGETAEKSVEMISGLLEKYGQWGSAVQGKNHEEGGYENAYLLADRKEAWILETTGRRWVAKKVKNGVRTLSNEPGIRREWDKASPDVRDYAKNSGWWDPQEQPFDFALIYGDHEHYSRQVSHIRWKRTDALLNASAGNLDVPTMMGILRDHYEDTFLEGPQFHPYLPDFHTICMHDSPAGFTWGNTATSVVVELNSDDPSPPVLWLAYLPPCTSVYMAVPFSQNLPEILTRAGKSGVEVKKPMEAPQDQFVPSSLWWRFHRLVQEVTKSPQKRSQAVRELFDPLEAEHIKNVYNAISRSGTNRPEALSQLLDEYINKIIAALEDVEHGWGFERSHDR